MPGTGGGEMFGGKEVKKKEGNPMWTALSGTALWSHVLMRPRPDL